MIDPHYWPSIYPGIFLGLAIGFSLGGLRNIIACSLGGLAGASVSLAVVNAFAITNDYLSLLLLVVFSAGLAYLSGTGITALFGANNHHSQPDGRHNR